MKLADIIEEWISGDWGNEQSSTEAQEKVYCLRSADISPIYHSTFDTAAIRYISAHSLSQNQLKEGDIVIEKSGGTNNCSTGRVILITKDILAKNKPLVCSNFCAAFRVKEKWDSAFVYYYFRLIHRSGVFLNFEGKTSGIHNLLIDTAFATIDFPDIDLQTQKRIASVLSNIDRKIALNRAMNEELEQTARDLYDYWFLQFDFPDANGKPYRSSGGKMIYNPQLKREIPEGWEVKQIEDFIAEYKSGDWGAECPDSSHTLKIGSVRGADIVSMENLPIRYISDKHSDRLLKAGDIIVEISGGSPSQSTGRTAFISQTLLNRFDTPIDCTNFCQAISPIKNYELFLYYMWNAMYDNGNMFNFEGKTSGLKNFLMPRFVTNLWFKPSSNVVVSFNEIIQPMIDQKQINIKEINHLRSLRDELLPLLMNGQVTIE